MQGLNVAGLVKQIKTKNHSLIWTVKDGITTITNRHWMIKFDEVPKEVSVALYSLFLTFPEEGHTLQKFHYSEKIDRHAGLEIDSIFKEAFNGSQGKSTKFTYDISDKFKARVFTSDSIFAYINEENLRAIDSDRYKGEILMSGPMRPVLYKDVNYLVLPYRVSNDPQKEIIELFK